MRIKVGDQWFESQPGQPIMIELSEADRRNIANLAPDATRYAIFDDTEQMSAEQMLAWME